MLAAVVFVASSLGRPEVPTFVPTALAPREVGAAKLGPDTVTVDASEGGWHYFDFSRASVVEAPGPDGWDLGFQRHRIMVNGGPGFHGRGGAVALADTAFQAVVEAPASGYVTVEEAGDSVSAVLERWYDYSWTSHVLTSKRTVYAVRTADGRYAKIQIIGYYCPGAQAGCLTFRFVYQGDGGLDLGAP